MSLIKILFVSSAAVCVTVLSLKNSHISGKLEQNFEVFLRIWFKKVKQFLLLADMVDSLMAVVYASIDKWEHVRNILP